MMMTIPQKHRVYYKSQVRLNIIVRVSFGYVQREITRTNQVILPDNILHKRQCTALINFTYSPFALWFLFFYFIFQANYMKKTSRRDTETLKKSNNT